LIPRQAGLGLLRKQGKEGRGLRQRGGPDSTARFNPGKTC
jgi:hypothetical protein